MTYEVLDLPADLPSGKYGTRVVSGEWKDGDIHMVLRFDGPYDPNFHLFAITVDAALRVVP